MFRYVSSLFYAEAPAPVTYGECLLYPDTTMSSDTVVVGYAKDYHNLQIYMEYGVGEEKYFMIFHDNSRQVRCQNHAEFLTTGQEFHALIGQVEQHCVYVLKKEDADELFRKIEDIFWGRAGVVLSERAVAYSQAITTTPYQQIFRSYVPVRNATDSVAQRISQARGYSSRAASGITRLVSEKKLPNLTP